MLRGICVLLAAVQVCFIKTTNLDGESNLKIRRPVDLKENAPDNIKEVPGRFPLCISRVAHD